MTTLGKLQAHLHHIATEYCLQDDDVSFDIFANGQWQIVLYQHHLIEPRTIVAYGDDYESLSEYLANV